MKRNVATAAALLACLTVGGCANTPRIVRQSTPATLGQADHMHVVDIIAKGPIKAERQGGAGAVPVPASAIPAGTPIMVGALGGALGALIVSGIAEHEANVFADTHMQPITAALGDTDTRALLDASIHNALAAHAGLVDDYVLRTKDALNGGAVGTGRQLHMKVRYGISSDFSVVYVSADAQVIDAATGAVEYSNTLIYRSSPATVGKKTPADVEQMVAMENARYAALGLDKKIAKVNAEGAAGGMEARRMRADIHKQQVEHQQRLREARAPNWTADGLATEHANHWAQDHGRALLSALNQAGPEIARMLVADIQRPALPDARTGSPIVYVEPHRAAAYRSNGIVVSCASNDPITQDHAWLGGVLPASSAPSGS